MRQFVISPNWLSVPTIRRVAGCDPGYASGAIVELSTDRDDAAYWVSWARGKDGLYRAWSGSDELSDYVSAAGLASLRASLRWAAADVPSYPEVGAWAIEAPFGPFGHEVAESVGEIRATVVGAACVEVRPLWAQWAPQWLGNGRPTDEEVAAGVRRAMARRGMSAWDLQVRKIPLKATRQACYDAAAMALWALGEEA